MLLNHDKGYKGLGMEGRIARWYATGTARDMTEFRLLANRLAGDFPTGSRILEVAPGPGYLAIELAKRGQYEITGLDISKTFVQIARSNARVASIAVDFRLGNASAMPFADGTFDFIVCRAAFKNFSQPVAAINEMYRVLTPKGHALIMDLRKDASTKDIDSYIQNARLDRIEALIRRITFRYLVCMRAYSKQRFCEMAASSCFGGAEINESGIGLEIILRKPREC